MKILYVANIRLPTEKAHGVQIMKMCEAFADSGHTVHLVVPTRRTHIHEDPYKYYGVTSSFRITRLPSLDLVRFGWIGFWVQQVTFSVSVCFFFLRNCDADIVYARDEVPLLLLSLVTKKLYWEAHLPRWNVVVRLLLRRLAGIISISQGLKDFYLKKGVPPAKIVVAHDGVDLNAFSAKARKTDVREHLGIPLDKPVVMYVGRLDAWKGVETLLRASVLLPEVHTVVIGEGKQLEEFSKQYRNVQFLGPLPYRDLPTNQQAADVLVIPNTAKSEVSRLYTSPLKVFTHMCSGVPIIASDLPSIREVLHEGSAVLVRPDDPDALAASVREILENQRKAEALAKQARVNVAGYSWKSRAQTIIEFIKQIV